MDKQKVPNILVVGDLMIDHYLWGKCDRISPEAPVQVVDVQKEDNLMGGAGNVINNLLSLGAHVGVCSVIGDDEGGEFIGQRLGQKGVRKEGLVIQEDRKTTKKSRIIALHQQIVRVDKENKEDISQESQETILMRIKIILDFYDAILLSDYAKGVLTPWLTQEIITFAKSKEKPILVDPKGSDYSKYRGATLITPNKKEAALATNIEISNDTKLVEAGTKLKESLDLAYALITLSEDGMAIFDDQMTKIPTVAREVYDVTGAGDTVLASLGYALSLGKDIFEAAHFANSAAAVAVSKVGSATVTHVEIAAYEHSLHKQSSHSKIKSVLEVKSYLESSSKSVVFTNGCFDILHAGHVKYLEEAKSYGDILVLGLNSDDSVQRLKGESRPINSAQDRAIVLAALESVDFVIEFTEDTPYELIKVIEPDILVKGGDYEGKEVVGSDIAKETRLVEFVDGKSTTKIIEKAQLT
ncbi:MAG: D-glycero-beta-D-manno-heptose-7-phosphate kinase [Epsilonproteobacteria bacterium]|nr:D-glycero-beta-D-manno-heptose-7-phosphate kinase [Campylobacterota bacterium]